MRADVLSIRHRSEVLRLYCHRVCRHNINFESCCCEYGAFT